MSRTTEGTFAEGINAFITKPLDQLEQVDVSKEVKLDVSSVEHMTLDVGGLVSLTYHDGEITWDSDIVSSIESGAKWVENNIDNFAEDYAKNILEETDFFNKANNINYDELKSAYNSITNNDYKADVTRWAMSQVNSVINSGDIDTIGDIADTFGSETLVSYFPDVIGDTLENWSIPASIPDLEFNEYSEYVENEFLPLLDGIDDAWDKFNTLSNSGEIVIIPNLSTYAKGSDDVQLLFSMNPRTVISSLVGDSQEIRDVQELIRKYRPYIPS